jgi:cardiolipin synthase
MRTHGLRKRVRNALRVVRRYLGRGLLCVLTGCHGPLLPYTVEQGCRPLPRKVVVARQVAHDTLVELTDHPLRTCREAACETANHLIALFRGDLGKRLFLPRHGPPPPVPVCATPLDLTGLERELSELTGQPLNPAHVQLHVEGRAALCALENLIARARHSIDVIMFQWEADSLGEQLAARLMARAGPGLRIRILIDGGGNLFFGEPEHACARTVNRVVSALSRHPHIQVVRIRNPFACYDHRKLVLIDGRVAWTGGRNFSAEAFFAHHDLSFVVEGPLVPRLQEHFDRYWEIQDGPPPPRENEDRGSRIEDRKTASFDARCSMLDPRSQPECPPNTWARLLYSEPGCRQLSRAVYRAIDLAHQRVYLQNVYLTDSRLICKLAQARRRGVDVRVVLTVESTSDIINRANRVVANRLLAAGVRVYLYPGMTHVKAVTVDGCWAYVGTGNFDPLSLRHNRELGLSVSGCPLIAELEERLFLPDLRPGWEMTQPLAVGLGDYVAELITSLCL